MLVIVVDDEREFDLNLCQDFDRANAYHCKTSTEGLKEIFHAWDSDFRIDELWLDHDLGMDDDTRALVMMMVEDAAEGEPWPIAQIYVHTANSVAADWLVGTASLYYPAQRVDAVAHGLIKR